MIQTQIAIVNKIIPGACFLISDIGERQQEIELDMTVSREVFQNTRHHKILLPLKAHSLTHRVLVPEITFCRTLRDQYLVFGLEDMWRIPFDQWEIEQLLKIAVGEPGPFFQ